MTPVLELHIVLGVALSALGVSAYNTFRLHKLPASLETVKTFVSEEVIGKLSTFVSSEIKSTQAFVSQEVIGKISSFVSSEIKSARDRLAMMDRRLCATCGKVVHRFDVDINGIVTCDTCAARKK